MAFGPSFRCSGPNPRVQSFGAQTYSLAKKHQPLIRALSCKTSVALITGGCWQPNPKNEETTDYHVILLGPKFGDWVTKVPNGYLRRRSFVPKQSTKEPAKTQLVYCF